MPKYEDNNDNVVDMSQNEYLESKFQNEYLESRIVQAEYVGPRG